MKVGITTELYCCPSTVIDLPIKSWDEVKEWYVKWDALHYTLDGADWVKVELNNDNNLEVVDWKRPASTIIFNPDTRESLGEN